MADSSKSEKIRRPSVGRNLSANFLGQAWRALMSFVFVPFYLKNLGVEGYGLIGVYTSLLMALTLLDSGLKPALAREMARFTSGEIGAHRIRVLLRSVELPAAGIAALIVLVMAVAAHWLAHYWIHARTISTAVIARAFAIMGLVAAAQFVESLYDSCLNGLQHQVVQNVISSFIATLRGFGSLLVLLVFPSINAFFIWQAMVALVSMMLLRRAVYKNLPAAVEHVRFSMNALREVRSFATGMLAIAVVALLTSQSDKMLLAKIMPLSVVGQYTLAVMMAGAISMLSGPIGLTFYSRFTQLTASGDTVGLRVSYRRSTRLVVVLVGTASAMLVLFGGRLVDLWIHDPALSARVAPVLAVFALAALCSSIAGQPYMLQLAHGVTSFPLRLNSIALVLYLPSLWIITRQFGPLGAALCTLGLAMVSMLISGTWTLRRFMPTEMRRWWLNDVTLIVAAIYTTAIVIARTLPFFANRLAELAVLTVAGLVIVAAGALADPDARALLRRAPRLPFRPGYASS